MLTKTVRQISFRIALSAEYAEKGVRKWSRQSKMNLNVKFPN